MSIWCWAATLKILDGWTVHFIWFCWKSITLEDGYICHYQYIVQVRKQKVKLNMIFITVEKNNLRIVVYNIFTLT